MLRHFEISFSLWHILFIKIYLLFLMHILKSLIKKVSTSLGCPNYYLLLFIKKIVVNITDFPAPFKIYKKISHRLPCQNFRQKLLICLFLEEITEVAAGCGGSNRGISGHFIIRSFSLHFSAKFWLNKKAFH